MPTPITDPALLAELNGGRPTPVKDPAVLAQLSGEQQQPVKPSYTSSILPLSKDEKGHVSFDSNAGILGSIKRAIMLPGDVAHGDVRLPSRGGGILGSIGPNEPGANDAIGRVQELASVVSPINPAARVGDRAIPGVANALTERTRPIPTAEELKAAGGAGFTAAKDAGVQIAAPAIKNMGNAVQQSLENDGIIGEVAPVTHAILGKLQNPPDGAFGTVAGLHAARRALNKASISPAYPSEKEASRRAIDAIDGLITQMPSEAVLAGDASTAGSAFKDALGNYAAAKRSEDIDARLTRAERQAAKSGSGSNIDNSIRQKISAILDSKNGTRGYSPEEIAQAERVVRGTPAANVARKIGKLGVDGGLSLLIHTAAAAGSGGMSIPVAVGGTISRKIAEALTSRQANKLDEMIRMRSPLYKNSPVQKDLASPQARSAVARALLLQQQQ